MPSASIYVARYHECFGEQCRKYRESVYVKGEGINLEIEAVFGQKIRQCAPVFQRGIQVGTLCAEGQAFLNNYLIDGRYADFLKAALEQIPEGWHSIDEAPVKTLMNVVKMIEKGLGKS